MPIYEYNCATCGKDFELLVRNSDTALKCPQCSGTDLKKKLSAFAMVHASPQADLPSACQSCGNPGGPGACAFGAGH